MNSHDVALALAGVIGSGVAVAHGIVMQRHIVRPIEKLLVADEQISAPIRRITAPLLHFSTYNWLLCGFGLIAAAFWLDGDAKLATGLFAGSSYLFGVIGNCWATRGRHPGWMLYALALALIVFGLCKSGG